MNNFFSTLKEADKLTLIFTGLLGLISLLMLESTVYDDGFVMSRVVWVQALAYLMGFIALLFVLRIEYTAFFGLSKYLYIASIDKVPLLS